MDAPSQVRDDGSAWRRNAGDLAELLRVRFFNRVDCCGAYTPPGLRGRPRSDDPTKAVPTSYTSKRPVTAARLLRHARGAGPEDALGAHTTALDNTCKWGAFDVDRHDDATDPRLTFAVASALYRGALDRGFRPLLLHSNGSGGYHLYLIFAAPVPCRDLFRLLSLMARQAAFAGEFFPKQPGVLPGKYGNWLRCPGRHHTREVWSEAFDGRRWLAGGDCVGHLLGYLDRADDPALVPASTPDPPPVRTAPLPRHNRPGPCDLAERIARYAARLPNLGAGEGRNRVAFCFAAFLARDAQLSDAEALSWLSAWDQQNRPPLGEARLAEVLRCAHSYGRHAYGSAIVSASERDRREGTVNR